MSETDRDSHRTEDPRVEKALGYLKSTLIRGETLEAWTIQRRYFALWHRRTLLAATSGRFIAIQRDLISGFLPVDIQWQDLKDVAIKVGIFGSKIGAVAHNRSDLSLASRGSNQMLYKGLRKQGAQDIYRICQAHEQEWREKRRAREIEELRARSGGVQVSANSPSAQPIETGVAGTDSMKRLQQAQQMLDAKLINDTEYQAIKAKIISGV